MIDCKNVYLDTSPVIYYLQNHEKYYTVVQSFFVNYSECDFTTSTITVEEYLVFPYQQKNDKLINDFHSFIENMYIDVHHINLRIAERAARIRAEYRHFKPMDALQLASACEIGCDIFLTNDRQLKQFKEINIVLVDELEERNSCEY